jgi:hypothetical protein
MLGQPNIKTVANLSGWTEHFGIYIFIENQQMQQNDHFIVMLSQTLLHVSAYQRHQQGAHGPRCTLSRVPQQSTASSSS